MIVKICGLTNWKDAEAAIQFGADWIGFVFEKSSPRFVENIDFLGEVSTTIKTVSVFGELPNKLPDSASTTDAIQWVSGVLPGNAPKTKIKSLRLKGDLESDLSQVCTPFDFLVLDTYHPTLLGGTGEAANWDDASMIVNHFRGVHSILLAGGLTPENVAHAISIVKPYGVDVSSGVESTPGMKDHAKIRDFVQATKAL